jgi:hypothetical protein
VNRNPVRYLATLTPLALAACSTPADVTAEHERALNGYEDTIRQALEDMQTENREYAGNLRFAEQWDHHWWGIPAGGWVAIFIVTGVLLTIGLCIWGYFFHERRRLRQRRAHELKLEAEKTEQKRVAAAQKAVERGNCQVCGAAPLDEKTLKELDGA